MIAQISFRSFLSEVHPSEISHRLPRISVIVAAYNAERFMRGALVDLEEQTIAKEIEIIIVETGSQTEEYKIIRNFRLDSPNIIYVRTSTRENPAAACNRGIQMARGQYITLAPTDDRRRVDALEILASELDAHRDVALVYGDVLVTNLKISGSSIIFDVAIIFVLEFSSRYHVVGLSHGSAGHVEEIGP